MKKTFIVFFSIFLFSCGNNSDTHQDADRDATMNDQRVEMGSGEAVTPQLELEDSARLDVDTISSPTDTNQ
jgi:hypothetical protein